MLITILFGFLFPRLSLLVSVHNGITILVSKEKLGKVTVSCLHRLRIKRAFYSHNVRAIKGWPEFCAVVPDNKSAMDARGIVGTLASLPVPVSVRVVCRENKHGDSCRSGFLGIAPGDPERRGW